MRRLEEGPPALAASFFPILRRKTFGKSLLQDQARRLTAAMCALDVKVGDKIIFGQYAGSTVKIDGEELLILSESEIFGVLEG